eukprot:2014018-Prymnesium_polylepis.1
MMHTPLCSPTDQGGYVPVCPDGWGTVPSCVSGSIKKNPQKIPDRSVNTYGKRTVRGTTARNTRL